MRTIYSGAVYIFFCELFYAYTMGTVLPERYLPENAIPVLYELRKKGNLSIKVYTTTTHLQHMC